MELSHLSAAMARGGWRQSRSPRAFWRKPSRFLQPLRNCTSKHHSLFLTKKQRNAENVFTWCDAAVPGVPGGVIASDTCCQRRASKRVWKRGECARLFDLRLAKPRLSRRSLSVLSKLVCRRDVGGVRRRTPPMHVAHLLVVAANEVVAWRRMSSIGS